MFRQVQGWGGGELKGHFPPQPTCRQYGDASSSVKGGYATAPRQALDTAAVRVAPMQLGGLGGGSRAPSDSDVTLDLTMPLKEDIWAVDLATLFIEEQQILISLFLRLPQHFL